MPRAPYGPYTKKMSQTTFLVQSGSNPLIEYKVKNMRGIWLCQCPDFSWRKCNTPDHCKHIALVHRKFPESLNVKFRQRPLGGKLLSERMKEG